MCSQGDLALPGLTLPFSCHGEICVMVILLDFVNEHKATAALQHLVAFCIHVLARQMVELRVVEVGLALEVRCVNCLGKFPARIYSYVQMRRKDISRLSHLNT